MKTKITDNWEVELTNDRGDTLTLKGEWYADFFKEYDSKQLTIPDVVGQSEQLSCKCGLPKRKQGIGFSCMRTNCDANIAT